MNNLDINDIVRIETMPKIFSQLERIGKYIDEQIKDIDKLECDEENKQEVKRRRTEINNTLKLLDDKRKEIKLTLLEPYEIFNNKYEQECKNKLLNASEILKEKIDTIEKEQKLEKENELRQFAEEHFKDKNIQDFVTFENIGLNITLTSSVKSLKEQVLMFCERIKGDISLLNTLTYPNEMVYEYKNNGFDLNNAISTVNQRHKEIENIKLEQEKIEDIKQEEKQIVEQVEEVITVPKEIIENEDIISVTFTITDTKEKILKLKNYLKENMINYE